jgi:uncharacterized coiled-coil DUF342 family protein
MQLSISKKDQEEEPKSQDKAASEIPEATQIVETPESKAEETQTGEHANPEPAPDTPPKEAAPKVTIDVSGMTLDDLREQIRTRERRRSEIIAGLRESDREKNSLRDRRDQLNTESAESFGKISEIKEKRDDTNKEIKELKTTRESVIGEIKSLTTREFEILDSIKKRDDDQKVGGRDIPVRAIQKEVDSLEWKLQTIPNLKLEEQRALMDRIETLSARLDTVEVAEVFQRELKEIRKRKTNLKGFLDDSKRSLNELVSASQGRHSRLNELYEAGRSAKGEADKLHQAFVSRIEDSRKLKSELKLIKAELDVLYPVFKEQQEKRRKKESISREQKDMVIREEKSAEIRSKLSSKKGLSMEELRLMMEQKMITLPKRKEE